MWTCASSCCLPNTGCRAECWRCGTSVAQGGLVQLETRWGLGHVFSSFIQAGAAFILACRHRGLVVTAVWREVQKSSMKQMTPSKVDELPVPGTLLYQQQSMFPSGAACAPRYQANFVGFMSATLRLYLLWAPWSMTIYRFCFALYAQWYFRKRADLLHELSNRLQGPHLIELLLFCRVSLPETEGCGYAPLHSRG